MIMETKIEQKLTSSYIRCKGYIIIYKENKAGGYEPRVCSQIYDTYKEALDYAADFGQFYNIQEVNWIDWI
jgi:hypothetical protein